MENKNNKNTKAKHRIKNSKIVENMVKTMHETAQEPISTDPQGSWTGTPLNENEEPVQDADDI